MFNLLHIILTVTHLFQNMNFICFHCTMYLYYFCLEGIKMFNLLQIILIVILLFQNMNLETMSIICSVFAD